MLISLTPAKLFVAQCTYEERHELKQRGFTFGNGVWWTDDFKKLIGLPLTPGAHAHAVYKSTRFAKSSATESDFKIPAPAGKEFAPYQRAAVELMLQERATLLADEPGVGKTATVVAYCNVAQPQRTLCIVPASVRLNWLKEFRAWSTVPFTALIIDGRKLEAIPPVNLIISSYDVLTQPMLMQLLNDWDPELLVVDEGHYLKEATAQRTKSVFAKYPFKGVKHIKGLIHKSKKFIDVTGTPALNRPIEFYPLLASCARAALEPYTDKMSYGKQFCKAFKAKFGWDFKGHSNEEQLNRILRESIMIRRTKAQVLPQLPEKRFQVIELDPSKVATLLEIEGQLERAVNHRDWVSAKDSKVKAASLKIEGDERPLIAQLAELKQQIALSKLPAITEIAENIIHSGEKLIIFAVHKAVVAELEKALTSHHPAKIIGGQSKELRERELNRFIRSDNCNVLIGNIDAAGVGVDGLQHVCSRILFAEIGHSPEAIKQAIDRACRRGQKYNVLAQFLAYSGSVDQWMLESNVIKETFVEKVLT